MYCVKVNDLICKIKIYLYPIPVRRERLMLKEKQSMIIVK